MSQGGATCDTEESSAVDDSFRAERETARRESNVVPPPPGERAMHAPDFDGFPPKKSSLPAPVAPAMTKDKPSRSRLEAFISQLKAFMLLWPVPRRAQAIFAEAFRQGLVAGLPVDRA